jgi:hypothetical protein
MNFDYDLVVAYRVYPKFSNPYLKISHHFNFKTKLDLFHACLLSFKEATKGLKIKIFAILDKYPKVTLRHSRISSKMLSFISSTKI